MNVHIDLGQVILIGVSLVIAIIGFFIKKEITSFGTRLDEHQRILFQMAQTLATAVGKVDIIDKVVNGRTHDLSKPPSSGTERRRQPRS